MNISQYAASAEDIDVLSTYQISKFFYRHTPVTRDDCNSVAASIIGSPVSPTLVQGEASYTVTAGTRQGTRVIQFRRSALNLELMKQARKTYGDFVPNCKYRGMLANVYIYEMDLIGGVAFSRARRQLFAPEMEQHLVRAVQDFARSID